MKFLPAYGSLAAKHAGMIFLTGGLEHLTKSLRQGQPFEDPDGLVEVRRRAQALVDAIDYRLGLAIEESGK